MDVTDELAKLFPEPQGEETPVAIAYRAAWVRVSRSMGKGVDAVTFKAAVESLMQSRVLQMKQVLREPKLIRMTAKPEPPEKALMPDVEDYLRDHWLQTQTPPEGEYVYRRLWDTAKFNKGTQQENPDFVAGLAYEVLSVRRVEVVRFELKPANAPIAPSANQAMTQHKQAHRAYLVLQVPDLIEPIVAEARDRCEGCGVGLIIFNDPKDTGSFREVLPSTIKSPKITTIHDGMAGKIPQGEIASLFGTAQ